MTMSKKALYQLYNLNKPFRLLILDKLKTGLKGYDFKVENKETDLRHINILSNWGKLSKIERMSFINDIDLNVSDEAMNLVLLRKEELKQEFKEKMKRKKSSFTGFFRGNKK